MKKNILMAALFLFLFSSTAFAGECKECVEVQKGKIPQAFLDKNVKQLPSGIKVWDAPEAIEHMNNKDAKILWVDTRPKSFYDTGTLKSCVNLYYDIKDAKTPEKEKDIELNTESLKKEMLKIDADPSKVTVAFFCQGPECHRSYNAAIRSVQDLGLLPAQVIWFRDGYPGLLEYIGNDPKLKKKMGKYLQGSDVTE